MTEAHSTAIMFDLMIDIELTIGRIYQAFAEQFPEQADTWTALADDETQHAAWLRELQHAADDSLIDIDLLLYNHTLLKYFLDHVTTVLAHAAAHHYTPEEALQTAVSLEFTIIEEQFYKIAVENETTLRRVFTSLEAATTQHAERLMALTGM